MPFFGMVLKLTRFKLDSPYRIQRKERVSAAFAALRRKRISIGAENIRFYYT